MSANTRMKSVDVLNPITYKPEETLPLRHHIIQDIHLSFKGWCCVCVGVVVDVICVFYVCVGDDAMVVIYAPFILPRKCIWLVETWNRLNETAKPLFRLAIFFKGGENVYVSFVIRG